MVINLKGKVKKSQFVKIQLSLVCLHVRIDKQQPKISELRVIITKPSRCQLMDSPSILQTAARIAINLYVYFKLNQIFNLTST
jgi:hypothetical protein